MEISVQDISSSKIGNVIFALKHCLLVA